MAKRGHRRRRNRPRTRGGRTEAARLKKAGHDAMIEEGTAVAPNGVDPEKALAARRRGMTDCYQDRCENIPFASVGGLEKRGEMQAPDYVSEEDREEYLLGYRQMARELFGEDWQTCAFS